MLASLRPLISALPSDGADSFSKADEQTSVHSAEHGMMRLRGSHLAKVLLVVIDI